MREQHVARIAAELGVGPPQVSAALDLLDQGGTVPFIARYRKEATGSLDEVAVTAVRDRVAQLRELDARRQTVLASLQEHGHLTPELLDQVMAAETLSVLEDLYLPYRPKRRTRATVARERGLEPLAELLLEQLDQTDPEAAAAAYVDAAKGVETAADALSGARDIIAETANEQAECRARIRALFLRDGVFRSRVIPGKETEGAKYRDYFEWDEPVAHAPSHRVLAMRRGEKEGFLTLRVLGPEPESVEVLDRHFVTAANPASEQVKLAVRDAYKRLLSVSMETEIRLATKDKADAEATRIFAANLRQLLLAPPLGQRRLMAIDPGFRTGCKLVCMDRQGKLEHTDLVYPDRHPDSAAQRLRELCVRYQIEGVAVGNGTGGRQTEDFVRSIGLPDEIVIAMVNESGASVYSASETARQEFPDHDVTVRGAVSIGRRLLDPLAELVKIEPRSIGVGQYQHDVDQTALKQSLDDVVSSCVNSVGVEVNTASRELLTYVSGLGPQLAANIVQYRNEHGPFPTRAALLEVPRLGPKAFELAAGFLRIRDGHHPLDASAVHPERYRVVERMAADLGRPLADLVGSGELAGRVDLAAYVEADLGLPTLQDIVVELARPGRDPRQAFERVVFQSGVEKVEDLRPGMELPGVVTNMTAFGVFVDVGVHQDGLVHISQLADRFVKDPAQVVHVGQTVKVRVLDIDLARNRIALTMRRERHAETAAPAAGGEAAAAAPVRAAARRSAARPGAGTGAVAGKAAIAPAARSAAGTGAGAAPGGAPPGGAAPAAPDAPGPAAAALPPPGSGAAPRPEGRRRSQHRGPGGPPRESRPATPADPGHAARPAGSGPRREPGSGPAGGRQGAPGRGNGQTQRQPDTALGEALRRAGLGGPSSADRKP